VEDARASAVHLKSDADYRGLSLWHDTVPDDLTPRAALDGDADYDVAIIGGGLTGLWTAYYLTERDPTLRIAVLEKHIAGFGASGRNGGWCSALFPASTAALAKRHGLDAALAMRAAMIATIDEVGRVVASEAIDCDFVRGGTVVFARSKTQLHAAKADVAEAATFGVDDVSLIDVHNAARTLGAAGALGATFDPACARLHPAKLVRGLARVLEKRGVAIFEHTEALEWSPGGVVTDRGTVRCATVIAALEGYAAAVPQTHRTVLPLYSLMIATEPLDDATWASMGIAHGQTFSDYRHLLIYGQRTADNRVAFGGRGARYHYGSVISEQYDRVPGVFRHLTTALTDLFPQTAGAGVTHTWGGPLGVPRDWHAGVRFDPTTRIGTAGGYVGDGLSTTNLAGRTLADLVTGTPSEITALPWVGHRSPKWEPEPLRFVGANLGLVATTIADVEERITQRSSIAAKLVSPLTGH
jgi:glycine/D-amino acid oxidase-like deaminating enzyme